MRNTIRLVIGLSILFSGTVLAQVDHAELERVVLDKEKGF